MCFACDSSKAEYHAGYMDELVCLQCDAHEIKSTNHCGNWRAYCIGGCENCIWLPQTDGNKIVIFTCSCGVVYVWYQATGWIWDYTEQVKAEINDQ